MNKLTKTPTNAALKASARAVSPDDAGRNGQDCPPRGTENVVFPLTGTNTGEDAEGNWARTGREKAKGTKAQEQGRLSFPLQRYSATLLVYVIQGSRWVLCLRNWARLISSELIAEVKNA